MPAKPGAHLAHAKAGSKPASHTQVPLSRGVPAPEQVELREYGHPAEGPANPATQVRHPVAGAQFAAHTEHDVPLKQGLHRHDPFACAAP